MQFIHVLLFFTQTQMTQRPLPLHRQHAMFTFMRLSFAGITRTRRVLARFIRALLANHARARTRRSHAG